MISCLSSSCEAAGEETHARDGDPGFGAGNGGFEVLGEAAVAAEPGEGALDQPSPRQELEAFDAVRTLDDLDRPRPAFGERADELLPAIDAVGEDVAQLGERAGEALEQRHGAVTVLNLGAVHEARQEEALGVGHDVAFAALDAFEHIQAARPSALGGAHALAVDDRQRRHGLAPLRLSRPSDEVVVHAMPGAVAAPAVEIALHRRTGGIVAWQSPPQATGRQDREDSVHHPTQTDPPRPAKPPSRRYVGRHQAPHPVGRVACIAKPLAPILRAGDFSPRHAVAPSLFATTTESQRTGITQLFSGRALRMRCLGGRRTDTLPTHRGARIMIIWRPSICGSLSTLAIVAVSALTRSKSLTPSSVWAISRPRKRSVTLTLSPSSKKRCTAFIFTS